MRTILHDKETNFAGKVPKLLFISAEWSTIFEQKLEKHGAKVNFTSTKKISQWKKSVCTSNWCLEVYLGYSFSIMFLRYTCTNQLVIWSEAKRRKCNLPFKISLQFIHQCMGKHSQAFIRNNMCRRGILGHSHSRRDTNYEKGRTCR